MYFIYLLSILLIVFTCAKYIVFPIKHKEIVYAAAKKYNVDPRLVFAVIKQESGFVSTAKSRKEAKGLMQIMDGTAKQIAMEIPDIKDDYKIYDPYTNINIGTKYLSNLIKKYDGNIYIALCAYNAGMGNIEGWFEIKNRDTSLSDILKNIKYGETKKYITNVNFYYFAYKLIYFNI